MQSFTHMSSDGLAALKRAAKAAASEDHGYAFNLNATDIQGLISALALAYEMGEEMQAPEVAEWAADFLSGLAQTVDIEFV